MSDFAKPIFIACAPRSGSTLLRLILDAHPQLAVPSPCWMYELNYPYLYSYGDLSNKDNFCALAQDVHDNKFVQNLELGVDVEELMGLATEQNFKGIYEGIHIYYAKGKGKVRWGEKSPRDCFWVDDIVRDFPDAQIVHLTRDGRDMAIDICQAEEMLPNNLYAGANIWRENNMAVINSAKNLDSKNYYRVRYEDLCADPEPTLKKVCDFLGEDYDSAMLAHHETDSTKHWSSKSNHVKTGPAHQHRLLRDVQNTPARRRYPNPRCFYRRSPQRVRLSRQPIAATNFAQAGGATHGKRNRFGALDHRIPPCAGGPAQGAHRKRRLQTRRPGFTVVVAVLRIR